MKSTKETALIELIEKQQKALEMANEIIAMKNRLVELCERETELHKQENGRLVTAVIVLSALVVCLSILCYVV